MVAQDKFTMKLMSVGCDIHRYNLIWDKVLVSGHLNANKMPLRRHEDILVFYKNPPVYNPQFTEGTDVIKQRGNIGKLNKGVYNNAANVESVKTLRKHPTSIITFEKPHPSTTIHPNQKPVGLLQRLIKTYTNECATIVDCCAGSGSTVVSCIPLNRKIIAFEWNSFNPDEYFPDAAKWVRKVAAAYNYKIEILEYGAFDLGVMRSVPGQ